MNELLIPIGIILLLAGGAILIGDRDVTHTPAKDRDISMVFQNYALHPYMWVAENMAFALKIQKVPKEDITRRVKDAAARGCG